MRFPLRGSVSGGDWVAVSGQVGLLNGELVDGGAGAQMKQALANFLVILDANGLSTSQVVKTTVFLTSMTFYEEMNEAYAEVFSSAPPARSAVVVQALPLGALVEVEGWVFRGTVV